MNRPSFLSWPARRLALAAAAAGLALGAAAGPEEQREDGGRHNSGGRFP